MFALWDGFDAAAISSLWVQNGAPAESGGLVRLHQNSSDALRTDYAGDNVPAQSALEWRSRIGDPASAGGAPTGTAYWWWVGYQMQNTFVTGDPWIVWISRGANNLQTERKVAGGACANLCIGPTVPPDTAFHVYRIERDPAETRFYLDGVLSYPIGDANNVADDYSIMIRNFAVSSDLDVDWIRARALASPEPMVVVGAEQTVP